MLKWIVSLSVCLISFAARGEHYEDAIKLARPPAEAKEGDCAKKYGEAKTSHAGKGLFYARKYDFLVQFEDDGNLKVKGNFGINLDVEFRRDPAKVRWKNREVDCQESWHGAPRCLKLVEAALSKLKTAMERANIGDRDGAFNCAIDKLELYRRAFLYFVPTYEPARSSYGGSSQSYPDFGISPSGKFGTHIGNGLYLPLDGSGF